jgi:hypothetical protein
MGNLSLAWRRFAALFSASRPNLFSGTQVASFTELCVLDDCNLSFISLASICRTRLSSEPIFWHAGFTNECLLVDFPAEVGPTQGRGVRTGPLAAELRLPVIPTRRGGASARWQEPRAAAQAWAGPHWPGQAQYPARARRGCGFRVCPLYCQCALAAGPGEDPAGPASPH